jgi:hypothetical protein
VHKLELTAEEFELIQGVLAQVTVSGRKHVRTLNDLLDKFEVPDDSTEKRTVSDKL